MITAEKWYEGQKKYSRYGLDMGPDTARRPVRRTMPARRKITAVSAKDRRKMVVAVFAVGIIVILFLIANAYALQINYENNQIRDEISALQGEVDAMEVEMQGANNLAALEKKAKDIGMVYPEGSGYVVLKGDTDKPTKDFAAALKEKAYN